MAFPKSFDYNGVKWTILNPLGMHYLGFLPEWWRAQYDERPVTQQLHDAYRHGGGWDPLPGFVLQDGNKAQYKPNDPDRDPPYEPLAIGEANGEKVIVYDHSWVGVINKDGTFEMNRMD